MGWRASTRRYTCSTLRMRCWIELVSLFKCVGRGCQLLLRFQVLQARTTSSRVQCCRPCGASTRRITIVSPRIPEMRRSHLEGSSIGLVFYPFLLLSVIWQRRGCGKELVVCKQLGLFATCNAVHSQPGKLMAPRSQTASLPYSHKAEKGSLTFTKQSKDFVLSKCNLSCRCCSDSAILLTHNH